MRAIPAILVVLAAAVASLPPGWCRALPGSPFTCCDACHDEQEGGDDDQDGNACQCNTLALKQADDSTPLPALAAVPLAFLEVGVCRAESLPIDPAVRPPPNYQRTLCRWRC